MGAQSLQRFFKLVLVFLEPFEGSHHVCGGYRSRLSRVLHPSLNELLNKLLSGVHLAVNHECKEVADQQTFAEGDPEHLGLAQTKALSDPLDVRLMPQQDGAGLLRLLGLLGFLCHDSMMASTCLRSPSHPLTTSLHLGMVPLSHLR